MCGIAGVYGFFNETIINHMINSLTHRGPDDSGWQKVKGGVLGHTRLSIIDLSDHARQPMKDREGRYTIVYNGEVYNYKELKKELADKGSKFDSNSDTEVILLGYRTWGEKIFPKLRGMFALAIHDARTGEVILARDHLGIKPLLYSDRGSQLLFASELKAILQTNLLKEDLDPVAVSSLLQFGSVSQPNTIIQGVKHLQPGHILRWHPDGSKTIRAFCASPSENYDIIELGYEDAVIKLRELLTDATRANMISDVEVGCFLSGGIDSTAVLALMQQQIRKPIHAFSLGFDGQNEVDDESHIAKRTAAAIGARFTRTVVNDREVADIFDNFIQGLDQPSIDGFNTYLVSREASKYVKVVLSGLGGDELFAGYPHFRTISHLSNSIARPWDPLASRLHKLRPNRFTRKSFLKGENPIDILQKIRTIFSISEISDMLNNSQFSSVQNYSPSTLSIIQNISVAELNGYLRNTLLRDSDAVSMWHSLEVRPVLLDRHLVDFALRLPDDYKIRDGRFKAIFVDAVGDLLPEEIINQPKRGFEVPFTRWMNGVLREHLNDLWISESARTLFTDSYRKDLIYRLHKKELQRRDWIPAILTGWLSQFDNMVLH